IQQAHVIGASMGGMIAQILAIHYRERVLSLTSWMSTYWFGDPDVPTMTEEVENLAMGSMASPPKTREEAMEANLIMFRALTGNRFPFDEEAFRIEIEEGFERGGNPNNNHGLATMPAPSRLDALRELDVPTLIIHGDEDPIINYCHGVVCAKVIPGAKLLTQKGVGHEFPPGILPETIPAILDHIGGVG
ncbi:MAG: alpha/beta hydrolase, partial [Dehalococcoidia bacterium]|nr:alpha/beta hydrolase [Dehalococcoidia bacterium]